VVKGMVRGGDNNPKPDLRVKIVEKDLIFDDHIETAITDNEGKFKIIINEKKLKQLLRDDFEKTLDVQIIIHDANNIQILKSNSLSASYEIEYNIRLTDTYPEIFSIDIYKDNWKRMLSMLSEIGDIIEIENELNKDLIQFTPDQPSLTEGTSHSLQYLELRNRFNQLTAAFSGYIHSTITSFGIDSVGYDGPQVPRVSRRKRYPQIVMWPRNEKFKWA
jgi:hypothetical protein